MATKLGAGYLELDIKYSDALKKINDQLTAAQKSANEIAKAIDGPPNTPQS